MNFFILIFSLIVTIVFAGCSTTYYDNTFALDFETNIGIDAGKTYAIGSFSNYDKNVNVTWEITRDSTCVNPSYSSLTVYYAKCGDCAQYDSWTTKSAKYSNQTVFPKAVSAYINARFFSAYAQDCNYNVIAKSVTYD